MAEDASTSSAGGCARHEAAAAGRRPHPYYCPGVPERTPIDRRPGRRRTRAGFRPRWTPCWATSGSTSARSSWAGTRWAACSPCTGRARAPQVQAVVTLAAPLFTSAEDARHGLNDMMPGVDRNAGSDQPRHLHGAVHPSATTRELAVRADGAAYPDGRVMPAVPPHVGSYLPVMQEVALGCDRWLRSVQALETPIVPITCASGSRDALAPPDDAQRRADRPTGGASFVARTRLSQRLPLAAHADSGSCSRTRQSLSSGPYRGEGEGRRDRARPVRGRQSGPDGVGPGRCSGQNGVRDRHTATDGGDTPNARGRACATRRAPC